MIGKKRHMVMVEKDVYEAMTEAYRKVKAERERNKELVDKLKKDLKLLDFELTKIGAKITELLVSINSLEESIKHLDTYSIGYSIKNKLSKKMEYTIYMIDGMEDKTHRLREIMDIIKRDIKPWEESHRLERIFEE